MCFICVRTCAHSFSTDAPSGTPQVTVVPVSQWVTDLADRDIFANSKLYLDTTEAFTVSFELDHAGTGAWPRPYTLTSKFRHGAAEMDTEIMGLLLKNCIRAKTFQQKVAAETAFQKHEHAHPEIITQLPASSDLRVALGHRLHPDTRGCLRGLHSASRLNDTLGPFVSKDPNNTARPLIQLADEQVRRVQTDNFEPLRLGTDQIVLYGRNSAAHLNGKLGTLLELKSGSVSASRCSLTMGRRRSPLSLATTHTLCSSVYEPTIQQYISWYMITHSAFKTRPHLVRPRY
jgi:hypothetical protein